MSAATFVEVALDFEELTDGSDGEHGASNWRGSVAEFQPSCFRFAEPLFFGGPYFMGLHSQADDDLDSIDVAGARSSGSNSSSLAGARGGAPGRKSGGVPLSSITKGLSAGGKRLQAVRAVICGLRNEEGYLSGPGN